MRGLLLAIVLFFGVGVIFLVFGWFWWRSSLEAVNPNSRASSIVVIKKGASGADIALQLRQMNLIRSQKVFLIYLKLNPVNLQAGTFRLSQSMSLPEIVKELSQGRIDVWVTIPEGLRREEIAAITAGKLIGFDQDEFIKLTQNKEGFLFPDTYLFPKQASAGAVVETLITNFNKKAKPTAEKTAAKWGLSLNEVLTLASLVEREAKFPRGRQLVASILLKRLKNDWPLQVDATLQYIKGTPDQWWPIVTANDKKLDSAFNTYLKKGLPPSPIANPGLSAIEAVYKADPTTPYWFYISDKTGRIKPAIDIKEHNQNIKNYILSD